MSGTHVYLVRHGATDWNRQRRAQGRSDIEMNDEGIRQSWEAARALRDSGASALYTSDLSRSIRTAAIIARDLALPVHRSAALREIDEGEWEGLTELEIEAKWPALWADRATARRPGGETPQEVIGRALDFLMDVAQRHPGETIIAVTHQSLIRWMYKNCKGRPDPRCDDPRWPANGEITVIEVSVDGSLSRDPGPRVP